MRTGRAPGVLLYSEIFQITGPIRRTAAICRWPPKAGTETHSPASEAPHQREQEGHNEQGMKADMQKVGAGIIAARGKNLPGICIRQVKQNLNLGIHSDAYCFSKTSVWSASPTDTVRWR